MTRLKNLVLGGLTAIAIGGAASSAFALEPGSFDNRLNGATIGLPLGALPPPGLYTGLETAYLGWPGSGAGNRGAGTYFAGVANAVPLLYVPGWNFLGATYAMSVVVAFYEVQVLGGSPFRANPGVLGAVDVFANPTWSPITLSWNLGGGWFIASGFDFMAPIAPVAQISSTNPDYWTFEVPLNIAYINASWTLAANDFFDFNTASRGVCCLAGGVGGASVPGNGYRGGAIYYGDYTAVYKFGKWSIGPVGFVEAQLSNDQPGGGVACTFGPGGLCGHYLNVGLGGLVGYNFGPVDLQFWVTQSVLRHDAIDGLDFWTRLGFRLWAPEAPKPLVAKN